MEKYPTSVALKMFYVFLSPFIEVIGKNINYQSPNDALKLFNLKYLLSQSKEAASIIIREDSLSIVELNLFKDRIYLISIIILRLPLVNVYVCKK